MSHRQVTPKEKSSFATILASAESIRPDQAKETLRSLSLEDRRLLEKVHFGTSLTGSLDGLKQIDVLTDEGAYNLLVQPHDYIDINGDGVSDVGKGKTMVFPPSNASQAVKDAWDAATENMSLMEKATEELKMHVRLNGINHDKQAPSTVSEYIQSLQEQLALLEKNRFLIPKEYYLRDKANLTRFLDQLSKQ